MNLTLANHHHHHAAIPIYPHSGGPGMEQLECREGLTKQWLLDQRCNAAAAAASFHIPLPARLLGGGREDLAASALGTTFPPQAHMLHAFRERLRLLGGGRNTCHSEPDLCHGLYDGENRDGEDDDGDDDHLFEFDVDDGEENDEEKSGGDDEEDHQLNDEATEISSPTSGSLPALPSRKFSVGSDSSVGSSGGCQHRKALDDAASDVAGGGQRTAGFVGSLFGSRSSGLGSERRSSQETVSEPEGLSFEPSQWRDYMLDRLSNDGTSSTPSASSTSLAASDGNATPIMAASPPLPSDHQPLVSPDSLLDPLEDQPPPPQLFAAAAACPECAQEQQQFSAAAEEVRKEEEEEDELELVVEIKDSRGEDGDSRQVIVASMGPVAGGEAPNSDNNRLDTTQAAAAAAAVNDGAHHPAAAATSTHMTESHSSSSETADNSASGAGSADVAESSGSGGIAAAAAAVAPTEEEELSSESEYAKEEEPSVDADAHLMADVVFSQQKLQELLNQLGKEDRFSTAGGATEAAVAEAASEEKEAATMVAVEAKEKATSPLPEAAPTEAVEQSTPERGGDDSSDHEISDHIDRAKLRKCSSLKSGRTPPGTPGVRKIVRFADIFGLDLQEVKTFTDEIPRIPRRAFQDLDVDMSDYDIGSPRGSTPVFNKFFMPQQQQQKPQVSMPTTLTTLVAMFTQPGGASNFFDTVVTKKVSLENAYMETSSSIGGIVRVLNIDYHKSVTVRWTVNDWSTFTEVGATYVPGSSDGFSDKFSFRLGVGSLPIGSRIQFCLRYNSSGAEFWDSNNGANYVFQVFLSTNTPSGPSFRTTPPLPVAPRSQFTPTTTSYLSPSQHGDDPWLRFM